MEVARPGLDGLILRSLRRTESLFAAAAQPAAASATSGTSSRIKTLTQYGHVKDLAAPTASTAAARTRLADDAPLDAPPKAKRAKLRETDTDGEDTAQGMTVAGPHAYPGASGDTADSPTMHHALQQIQHEHTRHAAGLQPGSTNSVPVTARGVREMQQQLILRAQGNPTAGIVAAPVRPEWHAPWRLMRVIAGHGGWVRCASVDVSNEWFVTGSADRTVKVWDLASGQLKLTLPGHVASVRAVVVSPRHPYLFSASEDKEIKCWDLEYNRVIRNYHGHLSAVYTLSLHPTIDVLVSGGRDSSVRVWDMRTKKQIHLLEGHSDTVHTVVTQDAEPQVVSGSADAQVRLWDLAAGRCRTTLTNHKKAVRALAIHPEEYTFVSGSADNIKKWKFPQGDFVENLSGHRAIINTLSVNRDGVLVSAADNGTMQFWDYKSGYRFQELGTTVQPGSLTSEAGIFASTFDQTGSRLITCEADKTIKIWKEDENATPETHPIDWKPNRNKTKF